METNLPLGWKTTLLQEGEGGEEGGEGEIEEEGEEAEAKEVMIHPPGRMGLTLQPTQEPHQKSLMVPTTVITTEIQANAMCVSTWKRKEMSCQHTSKFLIQ